MVANGDHEPFSSEFGLVMSLAQKVDMSIPEIRQASEVGLQLFQNFTLRVNAGIKPVTEDSTSLRLLVDKWLPSSEMSDEMGVKVSTRGEKDTDNPTENSSDEESDSPIFLSPEVMHQKKHISVEMGSRYEDALAAKDLIIENFKNQNAVLLEHNKSLKDKLD
eukprot:Selendium_serpulae@DN11170_c0_g1_i1.p1